MQHPANSRVEHGSASCRRYGCDRTECVDAAYRAAKLSRRRADNGESLRGIPAEPAARHARALVREGMLVADIARLSGVCRSLVGAIISGRKQRISQKTEDAILGVPIPDNDLSANRNGLVDATGARRRLQALAIQGFSVSFLAGRTSLSHLTVEEVRSGVRLQVTGAVNRKIADVCETYWNADPLACGLSKAPVERTRRWAREKSWIPLAAWDEETISDPQAHPNHLLSETPRYVVLVENTQELMEQQGYTLEQAADRQGVTVNAIQKARARYRENVTKAS